MKGPGQVSVKLEVDQGPEDPAVDGCVALMVPRAGIEPAT
jgi:hypothetical protein